MASEILPEHESDKSVSDQPAAVPVSVDVDARGLRCPLPLLKAKQALNQAPAGGYVRVLATDAGSVRDFHSYAELSGNRVYSFSARGGVYEYVLQKVPTVVRE